VRPLPLVAVKSGKNRPSPPSTPQSPRRQQPGHARASATDATELTMVAKGGCDWSDYTFSTSITYDSGVFSSPSFDGSPTSGVMQGGTGVPLYNWTINSYAPNGDVLAMTD